MKKLFSIFILRYYQRIRILIFSSLSSKINLKGFPIIKQPVLFIGKGNIIFGDNVQLGYFPSPYYYDGSIHIEARTLSSNIIFGNNIYCNNNLKIICEKSSISIGSNVLIGTNVTIFDSDFHELSPKNRNSGRHIAIDVNIKENVFVGSNVTILKGVTIGENSVIANGAVVTESFPANSIIGGLPAKLIKTLDY
jgi:acetyltransferase-like isoleucine patch superfamily enzyme